MLILNNQEIEHILSFTQITEAVEAAVLSYEKESSLVPKRMHVDHGADTLLCMPSFNDNFFGTKLVSVVPGNAGKGLPVTNGLMLLNDAVTSLPLCLLNAAKLTALRTGAVGALGVKYMCPETSDSVGLIGCGIQGMHQLVFACSVRNIKTIYCLRRNQETFDQVQGFVKQYYPEVLIEACATSDELLERTDIIIAATTSVVPVLKNIAAKLEGKHFISVGSYKTTMQELPDAVYELSAGMVLDSEFARHETGDSINPVKKGIVKEEQVFTIGKLMTGEKQVNRNNTTVYKTAGMALFDLFVAEQMYKVAKEKNIGTHVSI